MRRIIKLGTMSAAILVAMPVFAQTATPAPAAEPSVDGYLCSLAGKCGDAAKDAPVVSREAPPTKGFSLARPQAAPAATRDAPPTKGFSLARQQKPLTEPAPATRGFSLARSTKAVPTTVAPNGVRNRASVASRRVAAVAAPAAPTPIMGAMTPRRADLLVSFEVNSDKLTPAGEARARIFADSMLRPELLDRHFLISGHTDAAGNRSANLELSRRRAQAVADYLKGAGVSADRIEVKGMGFQMPLPGHKVADPANRRVEAELIS